MSDDGSVCPACNGMGRTPTEEPRGPGKATGLLGLFILTSAAMTVGFAAIYWIAASFLSAGTAGFFEDPGPFSSAVWWSLPLGLLGGGLTVALTWVNSSVIPRIARHVAGTNRQRGRVCPLCAGLGWYRPRADV